MNNNDQDLLMDKIKEFENHFPELNFEHLSVFSYVLRHWSETHQQRIIDQLVTSGKITNENGCLRRVE